MGRDQDATGVEERRFRWEQVVAVVGAAAAVANWAWTEHKAALQEKATLEQASIQQERLQKLNDRVEANARAAKQMELLPQVLGLVREGRCDSDLVAVTLLREATNYQEPVSEGGEPFGRPAARACLTMLKARQQAAQLASSTYCGCESLGLVTALTTAGQDVELARIAAEISALASGRGGPCAKRLEVERTREPQGSSAVALAQLARDLDVAARSMTGERYTAVLGNDVDCEQARTAYQRAADALTRGLPGFDPTKLKLLAGKGRFSDYLVTVYGDMTLEEAGQLVARLARTPGIRPDVYWARAQSYGAQPRCAPR